VKSNRDNCIALVLKDEGGYSNDPGDNGGPTKYGITIFDVRKYVKKDATADDVKALTLDQAKDIYKSKYWDALDCDSLSSGVDYTCFDYGVNSGLGRPRKALQRFKDKSGVELINAINDERMSFLHSIGTGHNAKFLKGWTARVSRVRQHSLELARQNTSAGATVGAAGAGFAAWASQFWHSHEYLILGCGVAGAIALGFVIHKLINKGK